MKQFKTFLSELTSSTLKSYITKQGEKDKGKWAKHDVEPDVEKKRDIVHNIQGHQLSIMKAMRKVNDHILSGDEDKNKINEVSNSLLTRYMKGSQADIEGRLKTAHKNADTIEDKEKITDKKRSRLAGQMTALEKITSADRERRKNQ